MYYHFKMHPADVCNIEYIFPCTKTPGILSVKTAIGYSMKGRGRVVCFCFGFVFHLVEFASFTQL